MRGIKYLIPLVVVLLGAFLGVGAHSLKNIREIIEARPKKVVLYLDLASIPAMAQIKNYAQTRDDGVQYIFALTRFATLKERLDSKNVHFVKLDRSGFDLKELYGLLDDMGKLGGIEMHLHLNMSHSITLMKPFIDYAHKHKAQIKSFDFYDDGSLLYVDLERFAKFKNLALEIEKSKAQLKKFFKNGKESEVEDRALAPYAISTLYPSRYHMLEPRYFDLTPEVAPIFELVKNDIEKINFFDDFRQRDEYMRLIGYTRELDSLFPKGEKSFVFTGTTTWTWGVSVREDYAKAQLNAIVNFTDPKSKIYLGDKYKMYFKGHPGGLDINEMIMNRAKERGFELESINPKLSFELLIMSGNLPTKVGGIASTLYFSLPKDKIERIIFVPKGAIKTKEDALKDPLVRVMLKLGIIKPAQVIFWDELKDEDLEMKKEAA